MNANEQIFWTFFISTMCGFILALGRQMYKSKCKEIQICCIKVVRDVESEEKFDEVSLQRNNNNNNNEIMVNGEI